MQVALELYPGVGRTISKSLPYCPKATTMAMSKWDSACYIYRLEKLWPYVWTCTWDVHIHTSRLSIRDEREGHVISSVRSPFTICVNEYSSRCLYVSKAGASQVHRFHSSSSWSLPFQHWSFIERLLAYESIPNSQFPKLQVVEGCILRKQQQA